MTRQQLTHRIPTFQMTKATNFSNVLRFLIMKIISNKKKLMNSQLMKKTMTLVLIFCFPLKIKKKDNSSTRLTAQKILNRKNNLKKNKRTVKLKVYSFNKEKDLNLSHKTKTNSRSLKSTISSSKGNMSMKC